MTAGRETAVAKTPGRISVEVTASDIERAHRNDSYKCVVAQAIARTVPMATNVDVDTQSIRFTVDNERRIYMTPYAVQGYVIAFDAGDDIEPFSFQLRDPRRAARRLRTESGKIAQRAYNKARREPAKTPAKVTSKAATDKNVTSVDDVTSVQSAAKAAYAEARAANPGPESKVAGRKAPPRVFKKKQRSYGHRLLRINQD